MTAGSLHTRNLIEFHDYRKFTRRIDHHVPLTDCRAANIADTNGWRLMLSLAVFIVDVDRQRREDAVPRAGVRRVPSFDRAPENPVQPLRGSGIRHGPLHPRRSPAPPRGPDPPAPSAGGFSFEQILLRTAPRCMASGRARR